MWFIPDLGLVLYSSHVSCVLAFVHRISQERSERAVTVPTTVFMCSFVDRD